MILKTNMRHSKNSAQCPTCGHMFANDQAFDLHRYGSLGDIAAHSRCLTPEEMMKCGFRLDPWERLKAPPKS